MNLKNIISVSLLLVCFLLTGQGWAADDADLSATAERHLGGHGFMPSQYIDDPFIGTFYSSQVGAAKAVSITRDINGLDGEHLVTIEGSVMFASLGMGFQQQLGQKWAVGAGGAALVRSGTNALSFINDGANVTTSQYLWAKRLLHRGEASQVTVGLNWKYSTATLFTPREFAQHIFDGGSLLDAPLVMDAKTWALQGDIMWAYAFNSMWAMRANANLGVVEDIFESGVLLANHRFSVMGEVDFKSRYEVPVGITFGTFQGFPSERIGSGLSGYTLGFWYTGKEDFVVGVETGWLDIPIADGGEAIDGVFGVFNIKYFF